ncbi:uncharacterized protein C24B11.05-like isoform X2 [Macadamia integrifolia]|uniref:uncharacterized protein C24B11.05-like isoform X2 n=1 Tax=Macadamia integrifolia TaxID=60698 RepID=UPI001C4FA814|nr:uncharacterized protein C24B11.05-like isoform X2 [Macadamia integrifolia]
MADLDDTLYRKDTGIAEACKRNIEEDKAFSLRVQLFRTYGSSLAGLGALGYDIDADDYHSFVHGRLPYEKIKPDPQLRNLLRSIKQRKLIFTNSDRKHAIKVLERLGVQDCFVEIICFETLNPNLSKSTRPDEFPVILKPSIEAMKMALEVAHVDPRRVRTEYRCRECRGTLNGSGGEINEMHKGWWVDGGERDLSATGGFRVMGKCSDTCIRTRRGSQDKPNQTKDQFNAHTHPCRCLSINVLSLPLFLSLSRWGV